MSEYVCATVTFLGGEFHGRADGAEPEWPPSPLRLFQALVAAAAARWRDEFVREAGAALEWLERQPAPEVIAPEVRVGSPYRLSVPNNAMDITARAWSRGGELSKDAEPSTHRAMKTVRPVHVPVAASIHYVWPRGGADVSRLVTACEGVSAVGWGVDLVAACVRVLSEAEVAALEGVRWSPAGGGAALRVPTEGTLKGLTERHAAFLGRLKGGGTELTPVPPLTAFGVRGYRRADEPAALPYAAFQLLRPDDNRTAFFDAVRRTGAVAGMMRHAVAQAARASGWPEARVVGYVEGHDPASGGKLQGGPDARRFSYLPLPSVLAFGGGRRLSGVQRVMVAAPPGDDAEVAWLRRTLSGRELIEEGTRRPMAVLSLLPDDDWGVRQYAGSGRVWASVTPVVLPGRDDGKPAKAERLLRRSLEHAGLPPDADLSWRAAGYWVGAEWAPRYELPRRHENPVRYHVRAEWSRAVRGPVAVGAGRYGGFGVMALAPGSAG